MTEEEKRRGRPPAPRKADRGPLAETVERYRSRKGWTQGQLATYAKVSRSFINQLEAGRFHTAEPPTLQRIATALGAPLKELLEAAGITDAPDFPVPELPGLPPDARYPPPLQGLWERLTPEQQKEVERHAQWVFERDLKPRQRRSPRARVPPADEDHDPTQEAQDEPREDPGPPDRLHLDFRQP